MIKSRLFMWLLFVLETMKPSAGLLNSQKVGKKSGLVIKRLNVTKLSAFKKIIRNLLISSVWDGNVFKEKAHTSLNHRLIKHAMTDTVDLKHLTLDLHHAEASLHTKSDHTFQKKRRGKDRKNGKNSL